jgi:hypothetical protein
MSKHAAITITTIVLSDIFLSPFAYAGDQDSNLNICEAFNLTDHTNTGCAYTVILAGDVLRSNTHCIHDFGVEPWKALGCTSKFYPAIYVVAFPVFGGIGKRQP